MRKPLPITSVEDDINIQSQAANNLTFYREIVSLAGQVIEVTSTGVPAGTEFTVSHGLGRVPSYVQVLVNENQTAGAYIEVRPSGTAWTDQYIYLHCNTNTARLTIRVT